MTDSSPAGPGSHNNSKLSAIFHFPARAAPVCPGPLLFLSTDPPFTLHSTDSYINYPTTVVSFKFRRWHQSYDNVCRVLLLELRLYTHIISWLRQELKESQRPAVCPSSPFLARALNLHLSDSSILYMPHVVCLSV